MYTDEQRAHDMDKAAQRRELTIVEEYTPGEFMNRVNEAVERSDKAWKEWEATREHLAKLHSSASKLDIAIHSEIREWKAQGGKWPL